MTVTPERILTPEQTFTPERALGFKLSCLLRVLVLVLCGYSLAPALASDLDLDDEEAGTELAQRVQDRPDGDDVSTRTLMRLHSGNRPPRERVLYTHVRNDGPDSRQSLIRFVEPRDVDGTGLLTLDHPEGASDQWLFLPALGQVRRIASSRRGGRFVGSDFYYEDLIEREVDMDHHRIIGREEVDGVECYILESIPVEAGNSVYSKRISWVHPEIYLPLRIDFYRSGEQPEKRLEARSIEQVQGYWTIFESTMHHLDGDTSTELLLTDIQYDQGLPDELFTQRGLADDSREQRFRPR